MTNVSYYSTSKLVYSYIDLSVVDGSDAEVASYVVVESESKVLMRVPI